MHWRGVGGRRFGWCAARGEAVGAAASLGMVSRAGLIDAARSSGCRVVGVTAPAGYGKSTLLAEWAQARGSSGRVGVAGPLRRRSGGAADRAGVGVRAGVPGNADLVADDGRSRACRCSGRAAPRLASAFRGEPGSVRADARRPPRAAVAGLPRRAERRDRRASRRARSWSRRVAPSSRTCPGCGRRATRWSSGRRPGPRRRGRRADLRGGPTSTSPRSWPPR